MMTTCTVRQFTDNATEQAERDDDGQDSILTYETDNQLDTAVYASSPYPIEMKKVTRLLDSASVSQSVGQLFPWIS